MLPEQSTIPGDPRADFEVLHSELRELRAAYHPHGADLHFSRLETVDAELFSKLLAFSQAGLEKVRKHRAFFMKMGLYDDGFFWYDLLQTISAACPTLQKEQRQATVPRAVVESLLQTLIDICEVCVETSGDMAQRHREALGNMLCCFRERSLFDLVREKAAATGLEEVREFVNGTVRRAEDVIASR